MEKNYNDFLRQCGEIKQEIITYFEDLMKEFNTNVISCSFSCDCPVVAYATNDTYTLDDICINDNKVISFNCSGEYNNDRIYPLDMDIELLISIYEWVKDNIEEIKDYNA
jgi:hypothetical protein